MTHRLPFETAVLASVAAALLVGVVGARIDLSWFERSYAAEDGPIEWATVAALLACAAVSTWTALRPSPVRGGLHMVTWAGLTTLCLFCAGEEVSWGQRMFGWTSSTFFLQHNAQGETNLHNLVVAGVKVNRLVFSKIFGACAIAYLLVVPTVHATIVRGRRLVDRWGVPVPRPRHVVALAATFALIELVPTGKRYELSELGATAVLLLILLFPANAAAVRPLSSAAAPALDPRAEPSRP